MLTVGRNWSVGSEYRYGFNGKEQDDEVSGNGNAQDFVARIYNSRLGRWLGIDQASELFAAESPYLFAGCNPIFFIDNNGKWKVAWRDNNDHSNGIVLEAEPGDNLQTLAVQMGIPYQQLIDENFKGKDFTINNPLNEGEWLRQEDLPGVETFQNINNWLKKDFGTDQSINCAVTAASACGLKLNASDFNGASDELENIIESQSTNVMEAETKIGDIVTYIDSKEGMRKAIWNDGGYYLSEDEFQKLVEENYNSQTSPTHYSVVLLKDKCGEHVQSVFEKPGKTDAKYNNDFQNDNGSIFESSGDGVNTETPFQKIEN